MAIGATLVIARAQPGGFTLEQAQATLPALAKQTMRIGINALPLSRVRAGAARVVWSVLEELHKNDPEDCYYLYSDRDFDLPCEGDRWQKRIWSPLRFLPGTLWLQTVGRRMIIRDRLDLFWGSNNLLPLGLPSELGKVVSIYDLILPLYSKYADPLSRSMHWLFAERSARQADRIIADSESTARDLQRIYGIAESKIEVIHLGVGPSFKPQNSVAAAEYVASKYRASKDYILTVGTLGPHKNLITLVRAMKVLRDRGALSFQLLVVGSEGRKKSQVLEVIRTFGLTDNNIRFLGFVPDEDLPALYSGSSLFVLPSLYEGFGLPLAEAMACGVPVIASNTSSIPEVVGDAGLLVPPTEPEAFAEAIRRVRSDEGLRRAMVEKGLMQAAGFRWDTAARQTLECMRNVVRQKHLQRQ
jgi:glycosyltransferase involved in cell wall biosynthesis